MFWGHIYLRVRIVYKQLTIIISHPTYQTFISTKNTTKTLAKKKYIFIFKIITKHLFLLQEL